MEHLRHRQRKLWHMTCESLFQILSASLSPEEILRLLQKHQAPWTAASQEPVALYRAAHKQCHHHSAFAKRVQRYCNRKHAVAIGHYAAMAPDHVRQSIDALLTTPSCPLLGDIAGLLWAVASDPRPDMRPVEQHLVETLHLRSHCLLLAQLRGEVQVVAAKDIGGASTPVLLQEVTALRAARHALQEALKRAAQQEERLRQDNESLRSQTQILTAQAARQAPALPTVSTANPLPGPAQRELRKLRYQVEKLATAEAARQAEIARLQKLLAASPTAPRLAGRPLLAPQAPVQAAPLPARTSLRGKKIAVIGGLDGSAAHYEHMIAEFGGGCLLHPGNQGDKKLAEVIKQADIVFCPIDCNSHMAATSTKKLCRRLHKSCYFLRSSGMSHLKEKLREIAGRL